VRRDPLDELDSAVATPDSGSNRQRGALDDAPILLGTLEPWPDHSPAAQYQPSMHASTDPVLGATSGDGDATPDGRIPPKAPATATRGLPLPRFDDADANSAASDESLPIPWGLIGFPEAAPPQSLPTLLPLPPPMRTPTFHHREDVFDSDAGNDEP
jgi:hypothetical protein